MKKRALHALFFNPLRAARRCPQDASAARPPGRRAAYHDTVPKSKPQPRPIERLRQTASGQDGQFATAQGLHVGLTRDELKGLRRRGETYELRRGVARFSAAGGDPDPAITAVLTCWPVGVISHRSAAQHHGIRRVAAPAEPEITVPHGIVRKLPGIKVHWSRALENQDILRVGGVGYTSLARTAIDLAKHDDAWETLAILDDAIAMGAKRNWVYQRSKALANGRSGVTLLRDATSPDAVGVFNSWLERTAFHVYRAGGLPAAEWNVAVYDDDGRIGIVDALWREWRLVSETEGLRFHTTPAQRRRDAQRFNRLLDARYQARRFTWEDVVHRPLDVVSGLYRALQAAGAGLDPARIPRVIEIPTRPFVLGALTRGG